MKKLILAIKTTVVIFFFATLSGTGFYLLANWLTYQSKLISGILILSILFVWFVICVFLSLDINDF